MARPIRIEYPGAVYHVTARGNERRKVFRDDRDRERFLETLGETVRRHGLRLHGFCLMPNHYHLLVETPRANLSRAIGWLQTTYTIRFNRRHRRSGHLFQGRFKAHVIEADRYAMELLRYVHLNPVRPRDRTAVIPSERRAVLSAYRWSSHRPYLGAGRALEWLSTDWLSFFGRSRGEAVRGYRRFVGEAFGSALKSPWEELRFGLALGGPELVGRVSRLLKGKPGRDELRWVARAGSSGSHQAAARSLADQQPDRRVQVWARVRLGGERSIDVARAFGYADGSAITQILKRLERAAGSDPRLRKGLSALEAEHRRKVSRIKS